MQNRVQSLDYLRGLMAAGIMVYHFFLWSGDKYDAGTLLGRLGVYGVSVFYVLSGLTLFVVYHQKLEFKSIHQYFIKRIFRIFPLLWLCVALTIFFTSKQIDLITVLLNLSGLFGFIAPSKYIAAASWSIGNELVFYTIFPVILLVSRKYKFFPLLVVILSFLIAIYFSFNILDGNRLIAYQWKLYIMPLNQVVLFVSGFLVGQLLVGKTMPQFVGPFLIVVSTTAFVLYPVNGDNIHIVSGVNRIIFILMSVVLTAGFLITDIRIGKVANFFLARLGEVSYSVYLIHPIVFNFIKKQLNVTDRLSLLLFSFTGTLIISVLVYNFYEKKFIQVGQVISNYKSALIRVSK